MPGVRGEGAEEVSFSLKGSENAKELAELRKENERLRERVDYWKGQTRLTRKGKETVRLEDAKALARRLVGDYNGTVEVETVTNSVKELAEYLLRGGDEMSYEGAKEKALAIAHTIADSALAKEDTYAQEYQSLRQYLKETRLVLGKEYQSDIADYGEWRKHQFGRLNLTSRGETNIDQVYHELSELYPEFFDEDRESHPADQLLRIVEVLDGLEPIYENPYSYDMAAAEEYIAGDILNSILRNEVRASEPTFADRQAQAVKDATLAGQMEQGRKDAAKAFYPGVIRLCSHFLIYVPSHR